eukprot:CAMPEP_0197176624 /NCGR_PEP_ID=MMETSP1423-20130617/2480_1 /TAXON_ID=476441 /ORGANISM="Pseudo-nitzschia heimii, Strain UNC1101" /LENGTH=467 /DNA_ID=CAMNT_0042626023 /DNA_START=247 /DNA_END=1650 /DNA_ORIENTATION=-
MVPRSRKNDGDDPPSSPPLFSVGVIADIQYAPIPDGTSYGGTPRYYRHALDATKVAFECFRNRDVDLVVNLGDIVDGKCQDIEGNGGSPTTTTGGGDPPGLAALKEVRDVMGPYGRPMNGVGVARSAGRGDILHIYGNHCLYNLNRMEIREQLGIPLRREVTVDNDEEDDDDDDDDDDDNNNSGDADLRNGDESCDDDDDGDLVGYYSSVYPPSKAAAAAGAGGGGDATPSVRFIAMDSYDVSVLRRSPRGAKHRAASDLLRRHNGENFATGDINSPEGLEGVGRRFVAFGGGVGDDQLVWLRSELEAARAVPGQKVVVLSHQPIHPESCNPVCLVWNYDEVLEVLREFSDVVVASLAGHAHKGGYALDAASGIHFRVVEAVLESPPPVTTFGVLDVYGDRLELKGRGDCESAVYRFDDGRNRRHVSGDDGNENDGPAALGRTNSPSPPLPSRVSFDTVPSEEVVER